VKRTVTTAMRMLDNVIDINSTPSLKRVVPTCNIVRWTWADGFQDACRRKESRLPRMPRLPSPTPAWRPSRSMRSRRRSISPRSAAGIRRSTARSGARASCRSIRSRFWRRRGAALRWIAHRRSIGQACATGHDHRHPKLECDGDAPTATISNICGVAQSIEPAYRTSMSNPTCQAISLS